MESDLFNNLIFFEAFLVLFNVPAVLMGLRFKGNSASQRLWFEPAGYLIPIVWIILFGLLAYLHTHLQQASLVNIYGLNFALALICAGYPYYTLGLEKLTGISAVKLGIGGNCLIILLAIVLGNQLATLEESLSYLTLPIVIWTLYTSLVLIGRLRLEKEIVEA